MINAELLKLLVCDAEFSKSGALDESSILSFLIGYAVNGGGFEQPAQTIQHGEQIKRQWLEESAPLRDLYYSSQKSR